MRNSGRGDDDVSDSVLTRIEGFAVSQHDAGYEQGYLDAWRRNRRRSTRRGILLLLIGLSLGALGLFFSANSGLLGKALSFDSRESRFTAAAEIARGYTVTIRGMVSSQGRAGFYTLGSGFVYDELGHIVTANHVVEGASEFEVIWRDQRFQATLLPSSGEKDVAVLRIDADDITPAELHEDSRLLRVGQEVLAVGAPFGFDLTVTQGIVSHPRRSFSDMSGSEFVQTDCPLNQGNSGGPLVDLNGRVVGMASVIQSDDRFNVGVGFALSVNDVRRTVDFIISSTKGINVPAESGNQAPLAKAYLGIKVRTSIGNTPLLVTEIADPNGPGAEAGIEIGDQITEMNGQPLRTTMDLMQELGRYVAGDEVKITVLRDGRFHTLNVAFFAPDQR